nr:PREDICTED: insulin-like peptide INSL5 [Struthio camelus australis]
MRPTALALALVSLLAAVCEAGGEGNPVKLCGRDFVRAIVFTCGGSRWKRHLAGYPHLLGKYQLMPSRLVSPVLGRAESPAGDLRAELNLPPFALPESCIPSTNSMGFAFGQRVKWHGCTVFVSLQLALDGFVKTFTRTKRLKEADDRKAAFPGSNVRLLLSNFYATESENPLPFSRENNDYADSFNYGDQKVEMDSEETGNAKSEAERDLRGARKMSALEKREAAKLLTTSCCSVGCSERDISSLC